MADKYAGKRGTCPVCAKRIDIPADTPTLELVPEDRGTYEVVIEPPEAPEPVRLRTLDLEARARETAGPRTAQRQRDLERQQQSEADPWWKRPLISIAGIPLGLPVLLLISTAVAAVGIWYTTGPGRDAHLSKPQTVFVVDVLDRAQVHMPNRQKNVGSLLGGGSSAVLTGPSGVVRPRMYTVGGKDKLLVTHPDTDGDYVLIEVALKQGVINNLGQTSGYDSIVRADAFELRKASDPAGTGAPGRLVTARFERPLDIDLMGSATSDFHALLPPDAANKADRFDVEKGRFATTGDVEYAIGPTKGTVQFSAIKGGGGGPSSLTATGRLTMTHPRAPGMRVGADYQGAFLVVDWNADARGQWTQGRIVEKTKTSPFERYEFSLLFPRPPEAGGYKIAFAGRDVGSVKLSRAKQPSGPAPSPLASNRPGGPQPASKNASGPLAYSDVLRDSRSRAKGVVSANNMRQIGFALQLHVNDHGRFPESLLELQTYIPNLDQLMVNPRTGEHPGFIYEQPPPGANPSTVGVLFESLGGQKDPEGAVLYGDGGIR